MKAIVYWCEDDGVWTGQDAGGVKIAEVRHAAPGEAEGGLGVLVRFMAGSLGGATMPALSPAGWYWVGTVEARGVWCRPQGPFATPEEARDAAQAADWRRD